MPDADLSAEDAKLVTLARAARARIGAAEGAAVRDETGRTYTGATVGLGSLSMSAVQMAVAQAHVAGARGLEAVVVVLGAGGSDVAAADLAAVRDLGGGGVVVHVTAPDGSLVATTSS